MTIPADKEGLTGEKVDEIIDLLRSNEPKWNTLILRFTNINGEEAEALVSAVRDNPFIEKVILESNGLDSESSKKFIGLISTNPKLTHLEITDNQVGDDVIFCLSEHLQKLREGRTPLGITLRRNSFTPVGARALAQALAANAPVYCLDLRDNQSIGDEGCQEIGLSLMGNSFLRGLDLMKCGCGILTTSALHESLTEGNKSLEMLLLQDKFNVTGFRSLGFMLQEATCHLTDLYLWSCQVDLQSLEHLCKCLRSNQHLETLALSCNRLDDNGALWIGDMILHNDTLKRLHLDRNLLTATTAGYLGLALTQNTTLKSLDLSRNRIKSAGVWALGVALRRNKALNMIDLSNNSMGPETAPQALCELFKKDGAITEIILSGNRIGDAGVEQIAHSIRENKILKKMELDSVGMTSSGFKVLCEALKDNDALEFLSVNKNDIKDDAMKAFGELLQGNKALATVRMSECGITDTGYQCIAEGMQSNSTVKEIDLSGNAITVEVHQVITLSD